MASEKSSSFRRHFKRQARLLSALVGGLALFMAAVVFATSFAQTGSSRLRIQKIAEIQAIVGAVLVAIRILFFTLPDSLGRRKSPSLRRRDAIYKRSRWQSRPGGSGQEVAPPPREGGSVLVVVLAMLAGVAALVLQVQLTARARLHAQNTQMQRAGLVRAASDAARSAMHRLADDEDLLSDSLKDAWAKREDLRSPLGIETIVNITDENRYFDLNNLGRRADLSARQAEEIVANLMYVCGQFDSGERVRALKDWVDADQDGTHESAVYEHRTPPFKCPDRPLVSWNELFDIDGWTRELFTHRPPTSLRGVFNGNLSECVTILPVKNDRVIPVNINTASRDVLLSILGMDQDALANAILSMRKMQPIHSIDAIQPLIEPTLFAQISPYLSVRSEYFRIDALAFAEGASAHVRALAFRDGEGHVEVEQWMF